MIPFIAAGTKGPQLSFAHANGYPPAAYQPLLTLLGAQHRVRALAQRPLWPGADPQQLKDWNLLAHDLLQFLDECGTPQVVGIGHSLGAIATLLAALQRPAAFSAVVLLDPVLEPPANLLQWVGAKLFGLARTRALEASAQRRRTSFGSTQEMFANYRTKPAFARLSDAGLQAYVAAMASPGAAGTVQLAYPPAWEAKIYITLPGNLWRKLPLLQVPLLVVGGAESDTFTSAAAQAVAQRLPHTTIRIVPDAGHLVPLERPAAVAALISDFVAQQPVLATAP